MIDLQISTNAPPAVTTAAGMRPVQTMTAATRVRVMRNLLEMEGDVRVSN